MRYLVSCTLLLTVFYLDAQNTFPSSGNVGIGESSPTSPLHIKSSINRTIKLDFTGINPGNTYTWGSLNTNSVEQWRLVGREHSDANLEFWNKSSGKILTLLQNGNVGVGTNTPQDAVHIFKRSLPNGQVHDVLRIQANTNGQRQTGFGARINFSMNKYGNIAAGVTSTLGAISVYDANNETSYGTMAFATTERYDRPLANKMWLTHVGNLGIGIEEPTHKLEVNGTIRSQEIKVEASPWPDYVFEPDYELESIESVEAFIQSNGHLPEIPPAAEMEAEGVKLGEMNRLLLKKIEELTLYLIEANKEKEELSQRLTANSQSQEKKIEELMFHQIHLLKKVNEQQEEIKSMQKAITEIKKSH